MPVVDDPKLFLAFEPGLPRSASLAGEAGCLLLEDVFAVYDDAASVPQREDDLASNLPIMSFNADATGANVRR